MHRPADHFIREIKPFQLRDQRFQLAGFRLRSVFAAPAQKAFRRFFPRNGKGNHALRQALRIQIFLPHQAAAAERAVCQGFVFFKHDLGAAAFARRREKPKTRYGPFEPFRLHPAEALLLRYRLADPGLPAAVAAKVGLPHDIEARGSAALPAMNIRDPFRSGHPLRLPVSKNAARFPTRRTYRQYTITAPF